MGSLLDVITYEVFQIEIFRGYDFTGGGVEFPIFLLIFAWALKQCGVTALPVINRLLQLDDATVLRSTTPVYVQMASTLCTPTEDNILYKSTVI